MSKRIGPNGYKLCKHGHERTPDNVMTNRGCRECARLSAERYREKYPERVKITIAKHYRENAKKISAASNEYNKRNAEKKRAYMLEYFKLKPEKRRKEHVDVVRIREAANRKKNPDRFRLKNHKRRARKNKVGGVLSKDIAAKLLALQKGKCRICKKKLGEGNYHLDHIMPLSKGGSNSDNNMQLLCPFCNCSKGAKLPHVHAQNLGMLFL